MVTLALARLHVPLVMLGLGASLPTAAPPQVQVSCSRLRFHQVFTIRYG